MAFDEMVDGSRGVRPSWRGLLAVLVGLGREELLERATRIEHLAAEEGSTISLPDVSADSRRFDPIPWVLSQTDFTTLEAGLTQRARLLDAVLVDVYGSQRLLANGMLPPELVYANPGFLRPCHRLEEPPPRGLLRYYAADVIRASDGKWQVIADNTDCADGLALALENRGRMARVVPELFVAQQLRPLNPFFELWADVLQRLAPGGAGGTALLTPGHADPAWYGHVLLARELSCDLVEGGDLTVRGEKLYLKTLRGLQPISVLLRGMPGRLVDPLELVPDGTGVPGLLTAARANVRVVNDPGSGFAEIPALAAMLPGLAEYLLHEELLLPSIAGACIKPSTVPCLGAGAFTPRPAMIRMFLISDGMNWHVMPGGLGCILPDEFTGPPNIARALTKDIWVLLEESAYSSRPLERKVPRLEIRRTSGDLPSRVADNFFWLGRYLERLEGAARLISISLARITRPAPAQHELAELEVLTACLECAGLLNAETTSGLGLAGLRQALRRTIASWGSVHALLGQVSRVMGLLRDRVTGEMQAVAARGLQELEEELARINSHDDAQTAHTMSHAMTRVMAFAATVAGLAAENMVRGGGRLFLDLGRRVERAQAVADVIACTLEFPGAAAQPARVEHGLRLALELCDSTITYRNRYLGLVQPAPVLDLVLADEGNPRSVAYQLGAIGLLLTEIAGPTDQSLVNTAVRLRDDVDLMVHEVSNSPDEARSALTLPNKLRAVRDAVAELSDGLSRRYFTVLSIARSVGIDTPEESMRGAA